MTSAPTDAEMYPLTDDPDWTEEYDSFAELAASMENQPEGLNQILSWWIYDEQHEDWEDGEPPSFALLLFMPRKSQTSIQTTGKFTRAEVDAWLSDYVRPRVMRWYGWQ